MIYHANATPWGYTRNSIIEHEWKRGMPPLRCNEIEFYAAAAARQVTLHYIMRRASHDRHAHSSSQLYRLRSANKMAATPSVPLFHYRDIVEIEHYAIS